MFGYPGAAGGGDGGAHGPARTAAPHAPAAKRVSFNGDTRFRDSTEQLTGGVGGGRYGEGVSWAWLRHLPACMSAAPGSVCLPAASVCETCKPALCASLQHFPVSRVSIGLLLLCGWLMADGGSRHYHAADTSPAWVLDWLVPWLPCFTCRPPTTP